MDSIRSKASSSRRDFLKRSGAAATLAAGLNWLPSVRAAGSDEIRVGLVGCGGRGTGAAVDAASAAPGVTLVAMADAFGDRLEKSRALLRDRLGEKYQVTDDRCFTGLDACERLLATDVNYVILAEPPGFRPLHLKAAVAAGKNVFAEKPVAVDAAGVRTCLEIYEEAKRKGLGIAAGTQYRHSRAHQEIVGRIRDGAIGEITSARCYYNTGSLWVVPREPGWTELEYQMRNWYYFLWLSGDHIVEQHIHNHDVANWTLGAHPVSAVGTGGRQVRTGPEFGHIWDHFAVDYEYPNGVHVLSLCRQQAGCDNNVSDNFIGTKGAARIIPFRSYEIFGTNPWIFDDENNKPYVEEHAALIRSLRAGSPANELKDVAESTLTAILGRMSAYTGKAVTWEQALNSKEDTFPKNLAWDAKIPVPPVAQPGQTPLI
jgi:predicted dehydrogenase